MQATAQYFLLAFAALLPLINPFGSALVLLGLLGQQSDEIYRRVAARVAVSMVFFLAAIEYFGAAILHFFGIGLPIVQVGGGLVIAFTAWTLLFQKDAEAHTQDKQVEAGLQAANSEDLSEKMFYPFTFPITAGPGALVAMLALSSRPFAGGLVSRTGAHIGIGIATCVLALLVYFCYRYAPRLIRVMSPSMAHGMLRVISFLLLCLGLQILWGGARALRL